ncbi:uncharacterized protein LOC110009228 [Jatropha curcas]|uniref:uncharacterized protein LOC110009228 n=1 Tax=Jatropha curcas TaxID=180498 RepID=UPI0009D64EE4|nr:uncharacterized protein LOC110009228 [Jatropha curcas]
MERKVLAVAVLVMLALGTVEAQEQERPSLLKCAAKCGGICYKARFPPLMVLCFSLCMLQCRHSPSDIVYNCTHSCARSMVTNSLTIDSNLGDDKVEGYVDSCYQMCNKDSNNI